MRLATLTDKTVLNNGIIEYSFCEECYREILKSGHSAFEVMQEILARKGKECGVCGYTSADFRQSFMFGCPDCYREMREMAFNAAENSQQAVYHVGKTPFLNAKSVKNDCSANNSAAENTLSQAAEKVGIPYDEAYEFTKNNIMSSRIRLARNIEGLAFPFSGDKIFPVTDFSGSEKLVELVTGATAAAKKLFDCNLYLMSELSKAQKTALVERHVISLPLANNERTGAVIIERGAENISVMLNEEDHIREQCVFEGFSLGKAYNKLDAYDDALIGALPVAYDDRLGFLTACPTNLGTGMRASVMLFLPALKLAGAIDDALSRFKKELGLTIRGVYGEGSEALGDMYQLSNARTLGVDEREIIDYVAEAALKMCAFERRACEKLAAEQGDKLLDKVMRSYGVLKSAYSLSSGELMELISDVKLGIILKVVPLKDTKSLDKLVQLCSAASLSLKVGEHSPRERDAIRATLVRNILKEDK